MNRDPAARPPRGTEANLLIRIAAVLLAGAALLAPGAAAYAHDDDDDGRDGDAALWTMIRRARVIDLSHTWEIEVTDRRREPAVFVRARGDPCRYARDVRRWPPTVVYLRDQDWSGQHGAPSIDAIGHIGRDGKLFGGVDAAARQPVSRRHRRKRRRRASGIDKFPNDLLINRGVLLDVARCGERRFAPLPATFEITAAHLKEAAKRQRVRLRKGDTVFIRTGWGQYFKGDSANYNGDNSPGPGLNAAEYLIKHGARIVGNDTLTFEQRPPITTTPSFRCSRCTCASSPTRASSSSRT